MKGGCFHRNTVDTHNFNDTNNHSLMKYDMQIEIKRGLFQLNEERPQITHAYQKKECNVIYIQSVSATP